MGISPLVCLTYFHCRPMSKRHSNPSFGEVGYVTLSAKVVWDLSPSPTALPYVNLNTLTWPSFLYNLNYELLSLK